MKKYGDNMVKADKGKRFVLTEKGIAEVKSYAHFGVGNPIDFGYADEYCVYNDDILNGYLVEVDDPNWVTLPGYKAVYDIIKDGKTYQLPAGNGNEIFFDRAMAERRIREFNSKPWNRDTKAYIIDAVYEGKAPRICRTYNGKTVYNSDWWFGDIGEVGDYVEQEIADWFANCVPPRTYTRNMIQCGEPDSSAKEGTLYGTLVRVANDIWEYKGACLKGTIDHGTPIPIV